MPIQSTPEYANEINYYLGHGRRQRLHSDDDTVQILGSCKKLRVNFTQPTLLDNANPQRLRHRLGAVDGVEFLGGAVQVVIDRML